MTNMLDKPESGVPPELFLIWKRTALAAGFAMLSACSAPVQPDDCNAAGGSCDEPAIVAPSDNDLENIQSFLDKGSVQLITGETYHIDGVLKITDKATLDGRSATIVLDESESQIFLTGSSPVLRDIFVDNNKKIGLSNQGRVYVNNARNARVENVRINAQPYPSGGGPYYQILAEQSDNVLVANTKVETARGELIILIDCNDCVADSNYTTGGWSGVGTVGSTRNSGLRNRVSNNTVIDAIAAGITLNSPQGRADGNQVSLTHGLAAGPGIRLGHITHDANDWILDSNSIDNYRTVHPATKDLSSGRAISLDYGTNIVLVNNTVTNCVVGVGISNRAGKNVRITNNTITGIKNEAITIFGVANLAPHQVDIQGNYLETVDSSASAIRIFNATGIIANNQVHSSSVESPAVDILVARDLTLSGNRFQSPRAARISAIKQNPKSVTNLSVGADNIFTDYKKLISDF